MNPRSPIIKGFEQDDFIFLSFTGQQYLFLILVQITATLFSQSDFFYSKDGKKEVFKIKKDLVVFKTKSPNMQGLNIRTVQFKSLDKLPDGLIKATVDPNQFRQEDFIRSDRVEDAYYMLEYNNAAQLALSNSIFVKPREGETIENVIRKSGLFGKIRKQELILPASGISLLTLDSKHYQCKTYTCLPFL